MDTAEYLCLLLNSEDCFDFDYQPMRFDTLNLYVLNIENRKVNYEFEYVITDDKSEWRINESSSEHLNKDKVTYKGDIQFNRNKKN